MNEIIREKTEIELIMDRLKQGFVSFRYENEYGDSLGYTLSLDDSNDERRVVVRESFKEVFVCEPDELIDLLEQYFPGVEIDFESEFMDPYTLKIATRDLEFPTVEIAVSEVGESISEIIASVSSSKES